MTKWKDHITSFLLEVSWKSDFAFPRLHNHNLKYLQMQLTQSLNQLNVLLTFCSCDFTVTATLTMQLLSNVYQSRSFYSLSALRIQRDVGLAGRAAVCIISVTCPAQQPAAPPVIRLEFILGLKILDSIWPSAHRSASLSPHKLQPVFLAVSQSVSQGCSLIVNLFCVFFFTQWLWNSFTTMFQSPEPQTNLCMIEDTVINT